MPKILQFRRGTTAELSTQVGAVGELFVDTTKDTVVVMDGSTAGGFPLATESALTAKQNTLVSGTNIKTINGQSVLGSGDITIAGSSFSGSYNDLTNKPVIPTSVSQLTNDSNYATLDNVTQSLTAKQNTLVSGTNIKTINGQSVLGSGNITISGGAGGDLTAIASDVLPLFSDIYDIGSVSNRWYDGYFTNKIDINDVSVLANTTLVSAAIPETTINTPITTVFDNFINGSSWTSSNQVILVESSANNGWNTWAAQYWGNQSLIGATITVESLSNTEATYTDTIVGFAGSGGPNYAFVLANAHPFGSHIVKVTITRNQTVIVPAVPAIYDRTLTVNADIIAPSVVVDSALVGTTLYEDGLITPELTTVQYLDTKGTLVVDGTLKANEVVKARSGFIAQQEKLVMGSIVGKTTITPQPVNRVISGYTNVYDNAHFSYAYLYPTNGNVYSWSTFSSEFKSIFAQGNIVRIERDGYWWDLQITSISYSIGAGQENANLSYQVVANSGQYTYPSDYSSYWASNTNGLSFSATVTLPPVYKITLDKAARPIADLSKLYVNNSQTSAPVLSTVNYTNNTLSIAEGYFDFSNNRYTIYGMGTSVSQTFLDVFKVGTTLTINGGNNGNYSTTFIITSISWPSNAVVGNYYNNLYVGMSVISTTSGYMNYYTGYYYASGVTISAQVNTTFNYLASLSTAVIGEVNEYVVSNSAYSLLNVGDEIEYVDLYTKLSFKTDDNSIVKDITFNNATGAIEYSGISQPIIDNATLNTVYTPRTGTNMSSAQFQEAVAIGGNVGGTGVVSVGYNSYASFNSVAIGRAATAEQYSTAVGYGTVAKNRNIAIGYNNQVDVSWPKHIAVIKNDYYAQTSPGSPNSIFVNTVERSHSDTFTSNNLSSSPQYVGWWAGSRNVSSSPNSTYAMPIMDWVGGNQNLNYPIVFTVDYFIGSTSNQNSWTKATKEYMFFNETTPAVLVSSTVNSGSAGHTYSMDPYFYSNEYLMYLTGNSNDTVRVYFNLKTIAP